MESTINENKRHVDDKYSYRRNEYYGKCPTCNRYNTNWAWCQSCDLKLLTEGWTSGNETLDELIKSTQLETEYYYNKCYLEWIPYNDLTNIERIEEGGFATIYKATWLNGEKYLDDDDKRTSKDRTVVLKQLHDSQNISNEFLNEFKNYIKFHYNFYIIHLYGLAQDPITKEYIFVMDYIENGSLQNYLTKDFKNLNWENKINILLQIINGLEDIHKEEIIHRDLHSGNILLESDKYKYDGIDSYTSYIADLGLSCPANQTSAPNKNDVFGVLPYVAPEVLKGEPYTKASDIYSFGVLMSVMSTNQQPFNNLAHDEDLTIKICEGVRPGFSNNTAKFYIELAFRCMDANPDKRPTAKEIRMIINFWNDSFGNYSKMGLGRRYSKEQQDELKSIITMFHEMDEIKTDPLEITAAIHPNAVYTSRLLKFTSPSQPVNPNKATVIGDNINI